MIFYYYSVYFFLTLITFKIFSSDASVITSYDVDNCTCGQTNSFRGVHERISGGVVSGEGEFPWIVGIFDGLFFLCAGTLINDRYVVSAAHCFRQYSHKIKKPKNISKIKVGLILGATKIDYTMVFNRRKKGSYILANAKHIDIYPYYDRKRYYNDVCLIRMDTEIKRFTPNIFPICMPPLSNSFENTEGFVVGWGEGSKSSGHVKILNKIDVKIFSNEECKSRTANYYFKEFMICAAGEENKDICKGDSGGPLMIKLNEHQYAMVGIASFVMEKCDQYKRPSFYTRLNVFSQWIRNHTQDATYCEN